MDKKDKLRADNIKMNDKNFRYRDKIKRLNKKLLYTQNIKSIWQMKDKIKELDKKILLNEQQVRFNLMVLTK